MDLYIKDYKNTVVTISDETYLNSFLPDAIKNAWDDPKKLKDIIMISIDDGLHNHVEQAALRLLDIDPESETTGCIYGVILLKNGKYQEAEMHFAYYVTKFPDSVYILGNLAKCQFELNNISEAMINIEKAINIDPENHFVLKELINYKMKRFLKEGEDEDAAYFKALEECVANYRSDSLIVWLGSYYAKHKQKMKAIAIFKNELMREYTEDRLFFVSGELARNGYWKELIDLIYPRYSPEKSRCETGYNLLQAHYKLWRITEGKQLLAKMKSLNKVELEDQLLKFQSMYNKSWWKEYFKNYKQ